MSDDEAVAKTVEVVGFVNAKSDERGGIRIESEWYNTTEPTLKDKIVSLKKGDYAKLKVDGKRIVELEIDEEAGNQQRQSYDWESLLKQNAHRLAVCYQSAEEALSELGVEADNTTKLDLAKVLYISLEKYK